MAEQADALDSKSSGIFSHVGSTPSAGTIINFEYQVLHNNIICIIARNVNRTNNNSIQQFTNNV